MKRHRPPRSALRHKRIPSRSKKLSIECLEQRLVLQRDSRNQPPLNVVPTAQSIVQGATLVFQSSSGNRISTSDPDSGTSVLEVTLSASKGVLSLSNPGVVQFVKGDGTSDAVMTFRGPQSKIKDALANFMFVPPSSYSGAATLTITTSDLGHSGKG